MNNDTKQADGGSAFPFAYNNNGMSLRDWFAGKALQGLLADPIPFEIKEGDNPETEYAETAYAYADAMLKARKKG